MPNLKFALPPTPNPNTNQWNICCVGSQTEIFRVGHVHFILFVSISFAFGSQRKPGFRWNMGLRLHIYHWNYHLCSDTCFIEWKVYTLISKYANIVKFAAWLDILLVVLQNQYRDAIETWSSLWYISLMNHGLVCSDAYNNGIYNANTFGVICFGTHFIKKLNFNTSYI